MCTHMYGYIDDSVIRGELNSLRSGLCAVLKRYIEFMLSSAIV